MSSQLNAMLSDQSMDIAISVLAKDGFDGLPEVLGMLFNQAMLIERAKHLHASPYERNEHRDGYANGFKAKSVKTRIGTLNLSVPQVRGSDDPFYPSVLEKGLRSERALKLSCAEMYVQGVSTRKVEKVLGVLCGSSISSAEVSRCASLLDEELEKWRNRPLGSVKYMWVDARYEKVRYAGEVRDCAVFIACGRDENNKRRVLGVSVDLSEAEVHWRNFFESLSSRGLHGLELITSDDHAGLKAARRAVFPSVKWQRCQFHLQQNAQSYVPKKDMKKAVAADIRSIFNAPNRAEADRLLKLNMGKYEKSAPKLSSWMEDNIHEGLTVMSFESAHQKKLRTSNLCERINKEVKRRTHVAGIFPNMDSCLRLASAVLIEIDEEWTQSTKAYMLNPEKNE